MEEETRLPRRIGLAGVFMAATALGMVGFAVGPSVIPPEVAKMLLSNTAATHNVPVETLIDMARQCLSPNCVFIRSLDIGNAVRQANQLLQIAGATISGGGAGIIGLSVKAFLDRGYVVSEDC